MYSYTLRTVYIKEKSTHNKELLNCAVLWMSFLLKLCCSLKYLYLHVHVQVSSNSSMQNIKLSWLLYFRCKLQHWGVMWYHVIPQCYSLPLLLSFACMQERALCMKNFKAWSNAQRNITLLTITCHMPKSTLFTWSWGITHFSLSRATNNALPM